MSEEPSAAPVGDRLAKAVAEGDAATIVSIGLHSRAEADRGNVCRCPEPEHVTPGGGKGDLMCGICGLQDPAAVERYEAEFRSHDFVESDDDLKRAMGWCDFCTFKADHPNHHREPHDTEGTA